MYFSVSFPESSMFAFMVIKPISKLSFGFSNVSKGIVLFLNYNLKTTLNFFKVSLYVSIVKVVVVLIEL